MPKADFSQNWGIIGHQRVVDFLKSSIRNKKVSHAYLFYGPAGVGRKKVIGSFITALFCAKPIDGLPCRKCSACEQIEKGIHPDVTWIDQLQDEKTEKLKKNITIEQIREVKNKLSLGSFLNSYKIAVINQANLLSVEASNALLKILEEPAEKVVIILIAEKIDYLPQTILSRCQKIRLEFVSREQTYDYLVGLGGSRHLASELSYLASGRPGVAINYFRNKEALDDYQAQAKQFLDLTEGNKVTKLKTVEILSKSKDDLISKIKNLSALLDVWEGLIRDIIILKNSRQEIPDGLQNLWLLKELKNAKIYRKEATTLAAWLKEIDQTKLLFRNNVNPQLALESLVLNFN